MIPGRLQSNSGWSGIKWAAELPTLFIRAGQADVAASKAAVWVAVIVLLVSSAQAKWLTKPSSRLPAPIALSLVITACRSSDRKPRRFIPVLTFSQNQGL